MKLVQFTFSFEADFDIKTLFGFDTAAVERSSPSTLTSKTRFGLSVAASVTNK